jgi:hypothetical protein
LFPLLSFCAKTSFHIHTSLLLQYPTTLSLWITTHIPESSNLYVSLKVCVLCPPIPILNWKETRKTPFQCLNYNRSLLCDIMKSPVFDYLQRIFTELLLIGFHSFLSSVSSFSILHSLQYHILLYSSVQHTVWYMVTLKLLLGAGNSGLCL